MSNKNIEAIYPLSPVQEGILFHTRYAPNSGVYVVQFTCTLEGPLNIPTFKQAWQQVIDLHPVLRTLFAYERREKPLQIVHWHVDLPWAQEDWRGLSQTKQAERLETLLQMDREQGFDLLKAPLMRLFLLRVADEQYHFVWSFHHLLLDGWSISLILKQLFGFNEMLEQGRYWSLEPSRPYKAYINWLKKQDLAKAELFWQKRLQNFSAPTPIGIERRASSDTPTTAFDEQQIRLSAATTAALQAFAQKHHLTRNTVIQGAWGLLLSRYSGEKDILFGIIVSGRSGNLTGVESMVGLFINTLPVRMTISPNMDLLTWLKACHAQQQELREYEHSPLVLVQGCSEVPRDQPLFESILVFDDYPTGDALQEQSHSLKIRNIRFLERTNYPLTVLVESGEEYTLRITYDGERFDGATIGRMLGHFRALLEGMVANPQQRLSELRLLSEVERHQMLVEWNQTQLYPKHRAIHELFERQVDNIFVAPRTDSEKVLAGIWHEILGIKQVGIHDDFFNLGGHSLLATKVIARIHKVFDVHIPLNDLFESPTIADLATTIVQKKAAQMDEAMLLELLNELP